MMPFALFLSAGLLTAPPSEARRPLPPLFSALDVNGDGVIDAGEITNATAALRKLDRNGDGRLSPDEYRPPRPGASAAPPPTDPGEPAATQRPRPSRQHPPRPAIDEALDADGDEVISAAEMAQAPTLLKKLDRNGDGKLSLVECLPQRPPQAEAPK